MWILYEGRQRSSHLEHAGVLLTVGEDHVVGRKDCSILIQGDASISRKHSVLTVQHDARHLNDPNERSQVVLQDFSKYGTSVNGVKISGKVSLKNGDEILFGKNDSYYKLKHNPLVVATSCLDEEKKEVLKSKIHKLGGHIVNDWRQGIVSHLVMDGLTFTIKVIHALAECRPIVKPSYFEDVIGAGDSRSTLPAAESYLPVLKEDTISSQDASFLPNVARKNLLKGKTFIFISKKQYKRVHHAVESSGGITLLRDNPGSENNEFLVSRNVCVMMVDTKDQNTLPVASQQWISHVTETLRRNRCRPIPESELGLALLFISLDKYCNPSITAENLVSQSFQAAEIMSQRVYSEQFTAQEIKFKKPPIPVRHNNEDRAQGLNEQQSSDILKTVDTGEKRPMNNERLGDSYSVSPAKKRKVMEMENSLSMVAESLDASKHEENVGDDVKLAVPVPDSIVADSLEVKRDSSSEGDLEPQDRKKDLVNSIVSIADSVDVSDNSHVTVDELLGCEELYQKEIEQSGTTWLRTKEDLKSKEVRKKDKDFTCELVKQPLEMENPSSLEVHNKEGAADLWKNLHVPAGYLCSRIPRRVSRNDVFEDDASHLPRNLMVVDQMSLVVRRLTSVAAVKETQQSTTNKNFKKFKKQSYPGSHSSLPRIIGGSDLTVHQTAERLDTDEWFVEAREADVERQREERRADELFRWEDKPTKVRRTRR
ncbi:nibrin-like isoform X2 [Stylophora pistillata]|uniref:nibrin-like isoform X2 n=1 Tax=Stylophora pistillata TaxID=50429 RepID=UPI000C03E085|nr:nibrin-like isoform X2 [Stylophora pistillata]